MKDENHEPIPCQIVQSQEYHIGRFDVVKDIVAANGRQYPYSYIRQRDSVCVLPVYRNQIILIRQYRHCVRRWLLETPAGEIDAGETSEQAARRELEEETGYIADSVTPLGEYFVSEGTSSGRTLLFLAECSRCVPCRREGFELIEVIKCPIDRFSQMIENGEFRFWPGILGWYKAYGAVKR